MKQKIAIFLALSILILGGGCNAGPAGEITSTPTTYQTPAIDNYTIDDVLEADKLARETVKALIN